MTATWGPESTEVRWLLVDLLVQIRDGRAKDVFLEFGPKVGLEDSDPLARKTGDRITVNTGALERAFHCVTRENAFDGDYGTWNFGDIQWSWIGRLGYTTYRYWMNHGKGWSIVPWVLWLRSGEREYWENGEALARDPWKERVLYFRQNPMLRDWVIAIADQAERGKNEESLTTGPPLFFNAQLPLPEGEDEGWEKSRGRHLVLALVKEGQPLTVNLHFMMHNQGRKNTLRVRVTDPENRRVADILREIENSYTEPEAVQGIAVQIPTGPGGVYAIELWSKVGAYPVRAESTDGKVVHVLPPGRRAVCSPTFGGQGWFRPKGNGEILIGYPGNFPGARVIAFDPSGRIAGASQIHSTRLVETNVGPRQQPVGKPCRFQPDPNAQGLYSFITANNDWHAEG